MEWMVVINFLLAFRGHFLLTKLRLFARFNSSRWRGVVGMVTTVNIDDKHLIMVIKVLNEISGIRWEIYENEGRAELASGNHHLPIHFRVYPLAIKLEISEWAVKLLPVFGKADGGIALCIINAGIVGADYSSGAYSEITPYPELNDPSEISELLRSAAKIFDGFCGCLCRLRGDLLLVCNHRETDPIRLINSENPFWQQVEIEREIQAGRLDSETGCIAETLLAIFRALPWIAEAIRLSK
jgi:hypothetical protein